MQYVTVQEVELGKIISKENLQELGLVRYFRLRFNSQQSGIVTFLEVKNINPLYFFSCLFNIIIWQIAI